LRTERLLDRRSLGRRFCEQDTYHPVGYFCALGRDCTAGPAKTSRNVAKADYTGPWQLTPSAGFPLDFGIPSAVK